MNEPPIELERIVIEHTRKKYKGKPEEFVDKKIDKALNSTKAYISAIKNKRKVVK